MAKQKVFVTSMVGEAKNCDFELPPTTTIRELVQQVADVQGHAADNIQLVKDGRVLELDQTLKGAGVNDKETLKAKPKDTEGGRVRLQ